MRTALRTAIATALVAGVAITPALTAGAAVAADHAPKAGAGVTADADGTYVRTLALPNGAEAKIFKVGATHFRAELFKEGQRVGTLDADGRAVAGNDDGTFLVLHPSGETATWRGNYLPGADPGTYELVNGVRVELVAERGGYTLKAGGQILTTDGDRKVMTYGDAIIVVEPDGGLAAYVRGAARQAAPRLVAAPGQVRTVELPNGVEARIFRVSDDHHRAEIYREGRNVGTLDADHRSVAGNDNGQFLVLHADGTTLSWVGNYVPGAEPGRYKLVDGTTLELAKKDGRYGIQQLRWGTEGTGFAYLKEDRQVFHFNNAVVVLESDGGFAAYVLGAARQAAPKPVTRVDDCTTVTTVGIGAGTEAELTMSPEGPKAVLRDLGSGEQVFRTLDRTHPSLPESAGIVARIDHPFSATPSLYTKVEGGTAKGGTHAFPALPKGCELKPVKGANGTGSGAGAGAGTGTGTGTGSGSGTGTHGSAGTAVTTGGQTSVVPRGGVAAGAELAAGESSATLLAVGAGAASLAAAGLGFTVLRRRSAAARG
ncbi:hypothetical protein [Streptomyces sp. NPDC058486]|uniref:hypothetical protein n=1 Tax=unclassified Streptomyces TaxID=2593676 RepID=UPI00364F6514